MVYLTISLVAPLYPAGCTISLVAPLYPAGCPYLFHWLHLCTVLVVLVTGCAGCTYLFHWLHPYPVLVVLVTGCTLALCWLYLPISLVAPLHPAGCTYLFHWLHPCRPAHSEPGCRYSLCKLWQQWRHLQRYS